jgi:hypothetical protein
MRVSRRSESWRTYLGFVLVGTIFILSRALSGGVSGKEPAAAAADFGDRSYREMPDATSRGSVEPAGIYQ